MNPPKLDNKLYFVSFCIEQYKQHKHLDGATAMQLLERTGALKYLADNYDVLHTQGASWLMAELDEYIAVSLQ